MKYDKREATEWVREHARGFVDTVATAFTPTLEIDEEGIRRDVRYLVGEMKLLGACSTGYNGERGSLTTAETARVNAIMTEECHRVNPDTIAAPCAYHYNLSECIGLIQAAKAAGADIVLLGTMFMEHYPPEVMYRYFKEISDRTSIGIFLMDFPQPIPLETLARLAALGLTYLFRELYGARSASGERPLTTDDGRLVETKDDVSWESIRERFVIGDPDYVVEELKKYQRELGATEMICWMNVPGVRGKEALSSIELFAQEVMPAFAEGAA